jgi:hypothetical protein
MRMDAVELERNAAMVGRIIARLIADGWLPPHRVSMPEIKRQLSCRLYSYTARYLEAVPRMVSRSRKRGPERRG